MKSQIMEDVSHGVEGLEPSHAAGGSAEVALGNSLAGL